MVVLLQTEYCETKGQGEVRLFPLVLQELCTVYGIAPTILMQQLKSKVLKEAIS